MAQRFSQASDGRGMKLIGSHMHVLPLKFRRYSKTLVAVAFAVWVFEVLNFRIPTLEAESSRVFISKIVIDNLKNARG